MPPIELRVLRPHLGMCVCNAAFNEGVVCRVHLHSWGQQDEFIDLCGRLETLEDASVLVKLLEKPATVTA